MDQLVEWEPRLVVHGDHLLKDIDQIARMSMARQLLCRGGNGMPKWLSVLKERHHWNLLLQVVTFEYWSTCDHEKTSSSCPGCE